MKTRANRDAERFVEDGGGVNGREALQRERGKSDAGVGRRRWRNVNSIVVRDGAQQSIDHLSFMGERRSCVQLG